MIMWRGIRRRKIRRNRNDAEEEEERSEGEKGWAEEEKREMGRK